MRLRGKHHIPDMFEQLPYREIEGDGDSQKNAVGNPSNQTASLKLGTVREIGEQSYPALGGIGMEQGRPGGVPKHEESYPLGPGEFPNRLA